MKTGIQFFIVKIDTELDEERLRYLVEQGMSRMPSVGLGSGSATTGSGGYPTPIKPLKLRSIPWNLAPFDLSLGRT